MVITLIFASFTYGFYSGATKIIPYYFIKNLKYELTDGYKDYETIPDISSLPPISINTREDAENKRQELIEFIWKGKGIPTRLPDKIEDDGFVVNMEYNVNSIVKYYHSDNPTNKLVIYHQGHRGDFIIEPFLEQGYDVITFSMPLLTEEFGGFNNQPIVNLGNLGNIKLINHDALRFLDSDNFSSIKFFVEPIAVVLNYLENNYNEMYMIGHSGGGWTTTIYPAIDIRIKESYSISGSSPIYLQTLSPNNGLEHYEESLPELYQIANYLEIYVLASYGENRKHIQILNQYDACCKKGIGYKTYESYVNKTVNTLGLGEYRVYLNANKIRGDGISTHFITDDILNFIFEEMRKN